MSAVPAKNTLDRLREREADEKQKGKSGPRQERSPEPDSERESPADVLIRMGRRLPLFHDGDGNCFAAIPRGDGRSRTVPITSRGLGSWLRREYFAARGKGVTEGNLSTALMTLASLAEFTGKKERVFVRLGIVGDMLVLDLADDLGQIVEITKDGWTITRSSAVRLWQPAGMRPLPVPIRGGSLDLLWPLLNVDAQDRILVAAWMLMALNPHGPYPGLFLHGQQGSAKSTTAALLRRLIDPNKCPLRQPPRDEDALVIAARNGLIVGLDNLSFIDQEVSDSLCRLMTGGGIGKRKLYSDADEVLIDIKRPLLVTGIPELANAGDLADRVITLELPPISDQQRDLDRTIGERFDEAHPALLGVLLDAIVVALRDNGKSRPPTLSRMADFECWACAGLPALGFDPKAFLATYRGNKSEAAGAVLDGSPVAAALQAMMGSSDYWQGTAADLLDKLRPLAGDNVKERAWPKTARGLSGALRRLAPALLTVLGFRVTFGDREGHERRRLIVVSREECKPPSAPSAPSADDETAPDIPW